MGNYSAAWRFEVLVSTKGKAERWITYGSGLAGAEGSIAGEHEDDEAGFWYDDPVALAQNRLEEALEVLGAFRGGVPSRIVLWTEVGTPENPDVVIQATEQQMATGRLRAASSAVVRAATELNNARRFLREQVIGADTHAHLARNEIARELEGGAWSRRLVLQFLAGHDLVLEAQRALPESWRGWQPGFAEEFYGGDVTDQPFWCGPLCMALGAAGGVTVWMDYQDDPFEDDYSDIESDPTPPSEPEVRQAKVKDASKRVEHADLAVRSLSSAGLLLTARDGAEARVSDLMDATTYDTALTLLRPKRGSRTGSA